MIYITKIELHNVRCYKKTTINLGEGGTSILICGNNGSGKTALLRSIAMGLCDQASSGALLRDLPGDFIRKTSSRQVERTSEIMIKLVKSTLDRQRYTITTKLKTRSDSIFETVNTETNLPDDEFPWSDIFVAGYGAGLRTHGSEDYVQYFAPDAVYSLFEYSYHLQNPEIAWRRLVEAATSKHERKIVNNNICALLKDILELDSQDDQPSIENNGIFIKSSWGKHELNALGDGYQALVTITLDILSWKLLSVNHKAILDAYEANEVPVWKPILNTRNQQNDLDGVVIIDEIEKHLHPKLQHKIIHHLKKLFPKMQFIISTHSPLCVSGTADVEVGSFKIYKTYRDDEEDCIKLKEMPIPVGLTADEIFDRYFEISDTRNDNMQNDLQKYRELYLKETLEDEEVQKFNELEQRIQAVFGNASREIHEVTRERITKSLDALISDLHSKHDQG